MATEVISQEASQDEYMVYSARNNGGDGFEIVDRGGTVWAWVRGEAKARMIVAAMNDLTSRPNTLDMNRES